MISLLPNSTIFVIVQFILGVCIENLYPDSKEM